MQPEATLPFRVTITELPTGSSSYEETINGEDRLLEVRNFYNVPRCGECFVEKSEDGTLKGYTVQNVYHYTAKTNMDDGTVGSIQVAKTAEEPQ